MKSTPDTQPSPDNARWWILTLTSMALFGNYYVYDSIAPVADLLQRELGFSDTQIGTLNAIYSLPNIFMVLIGGMLVDRFGAARVMICTAGICLAGAILTALGSSFVWGRRRNDDHCDPGPHRALVSRQLGCPGDGDRSERGARRLLRRRSFADVCPASL